MKKLFAITLTVLLMFSMISVVSADTFIESPSKVDAPVLGNVTSTNPDWNGKLVVTSYKDRGTLPEELEQMMNTAGSEISSATNVTALNASLANIAAAKGLKTENLAVSTIFDVYATDPDFGSVTLELSSETLKNFVALLHYTGEGWEVVSNASVSGNTLTFTTDDFSPFAVVVNTDGGSNIPDSPQTGTEFPWVVMTGAVLFGAAGVSILYAGRKKEMGA